MSRLWRENRPWPTAAEAQFPLWGSLGFPKAPLDFDSEKQALRFGGERANARVEPKLRGTPRFHEPVIDLTTVSCSGAPHRMPRSLFLWFQCSGKWGSPHHFSAQGRSFGVARLLAHLSSKFPFRRACVPLLLVAMFRIRGVVPVQLALQSPPVLGLNPPS